jgi:hypothetical protein
MAMMLGDLRAALIDGGTSQALADKAATEVATFETRLTNVELRLGLLAWMVGATIGLLILVLGDLVNLSSKLGEISGQVAQFARNIHK